MKTDFLDIILTTFRREIIKKLVFSRPKSGEISKISGRLCAHRGKRLLALEYSLPGNTVSHKNVTENELEEILRDLISSYKQVNLITTMGEVEWKISSSGKEVLLGADKLKRKLEGVPRDFERAIEALDNKKKYILTGAEDFLIKLGISDKNGRIHDKKQGKFRQINRFLEYIEDVYCHLPQNEELVIYDLCCGKSYLSFAVYYYLTVTKARRVKMLGIDLKRDVIAWCCALAKEMSFTGMTFLCGDVRNTPCDVKPDMVISLHACDVATDIVIDSAIKLGAKVILSTPCCHKYLNDKIKNQSLAFVTKHPHLRNKLCEAMTDAIRVARLEKSGYDTTVTELTDPDDTPKNTLIRAIRRESGSRTDEKRIAEYSAILDFLLGDGADGYLGEFK